MTKKSAAAEVDLSASAIPDDQLENYGGDIAAWDSVGTDRFGNKLQLARRGDYLPGAIGSSLPDLNPPGTLVYREAPDLKFHFVWWSDRGDEKSATTFTELKSKGYKAAQTLDWIIAPELRDTLLDSNGRLTFAASKDGAHVVMYQSEADYRKVRAIITRDSDYVQQTAEDRASALQEALERGGLRGARVNTSVEDD